MEKRFFLLLGGGGNEASNMLSWYRITLGFSPALFPFVSLKDVAAFDWRLREQI